MTPPSPPPPPVVPLAVYTPPCRDTVSRTGVFCSLVNTIELCKTEGIVDVFQVLKALRIQKPASVTSLVSYKDGWLVNMATIMNEHTHTTIIISHYRSSIVMYLIKFSSSSTHLVFIPISNDETRKVSHTHTLTSVLCVWIANVDQSGC